MKTHPVEGEFDGDKRTDRQTQRETDIKKLIIVLCNCMSAP